MTSFEGFESVRECSEKIVNFKTFLSKNDIFTGLEPSGSVEISTVFESRPEFLPENHFKSCYALKHLSKRIQNIP